jgi:hypothetical protein
MPYVFDMVRRLEADPTQTDLARGFTAEVADPAWLLGRQWQLGEHHGEDASSPVRVSYRARLTPIDPVGGQPRLDPRTTPAEAVVESEPGDFWTPGRRIAAGRAVAAATALPDDPALRLAALPVPYDVLDGTGPDGRLLWQRRAALGLDENWFGPHRPPEPEPLDLWNPAELAYDATFTAGPVTLSLTRHDGGPLDWYAVDADRALPAGDPPDPAELYPRRVTYPGAPQPRWWQIEDAAVDIGGYPPDRAHLATLLLIDLVMNTGDNWFTFPVTGARTGHVITLDEVVVHDSFGDDWTLSPPADWSLFGTDGLDPRSLVVWATAATPLAGPVLDEVAIGTDEDANLVWAVEQRLRGRAVLGDDDPPPEPPAHLDASGRAGYAYRPMTRIPPHWIPYAVEEVNGRRRYVQGRAADVTGPVVVLLPEAESDLLIDPASGGVHPTHQIEPAAVPADGVQVERRAMLARATDGAPVLWTRRRRRPLLSPPVLRLRFDAAEEVPPVVR